MAMRLGIDLGTTRTVVAATDRGNVPIVCFASPDGDAVDHVPTVTAEVGGRLVHGLAAEDAARRGAPTLRSWKRLLGGLSPHAELAVGSCRVSLLELATDFLRALRRDLQGAATLPAPLGEDTEVVVSVPANAHSTQRFTTLEAFRRAGFAVKALLNEPSAAGIEYASRFAKTITSRREHIVVYDLGGGTFDAALVRMTSDCHDVLHCSGVARLGGDDFDSALLDLALERAAHHRGGLERDALSEGHVVEALAECRAAKESIRPNSRRIVLDLDGIGAGEPREPIVIQVADYYERVRPLVERTIAVLEPVLGRAADESASSAVERASAGDGNPLPSTPVPSAEDTLAGIYVVGGGSGLPLVGRILRERFGRRVHRSAQASAATAIGLALAADSERAPALTERLTRHFGVFRERDDGERISFDPIFAKGTPVPRPGDEPIESVREYRPVHDVGLFRFLECGELGPDGEPAGDVTPHRTIRFPFVAEARSVEPTEGAAADPGPIRRLETPGPRVREHYQLEASGVLRVTIQELEAAYERSFVL